MFVNIVQWRYKLTEPIVNYCTAFLRSGTWARLYEQLCLNVVNWIFSQPSQHHSRWTMDVYTKCLVLCINIPYVLRHVHHFLSFRFRGVKASKDGDTTFRAPHYFFIWATNNTGRRTAWSLNPCYAVSHEQVHGNLCECIPDTSVKFAATAFTR